MGTKKNANNARAVVIIKKLHSLKDQKTYTEYRPLAVLQTMYKDCGGRGGWTLVMGKGFTREDRERIGGKVLLAGHCAIEELYDELKSKLGKKNVYCSGKCNDLRAMAESMCHLMKVNPMKLAPVNPVKGLYCVLKAKLNKSHGMMVNPLAHVIKLH